MRTTKRASGIRLLGGGRSLELTWPDLPFQWITLPAVVKIHYGSLSLLSPHPPLACFLCDACLVHAFRKLTVLIKISQIQVWKPGPLFLFLSVPWGRRKTSHKGSFHPGFRTRSTASGDTALGPEAMGFFPVQTEGFPELCPLRCSRCGNGGES